LLKPEAVGSVGQLMAVNHCKDTSLQGLNLASTRS